MPEVFNRCAFEVSGIFRVQPVNLPLITGGACPKDNVRVTCSNRHVHINFLYKKCGTLIEEEMNMSANLKRIMKCACAGYHVFCAGCVRWSAQGCAGSVSSPGWYVKFQNQAACGKASARVTSDEDTAVTEAIGKARAERSIKPQRRSTHQVHRIATRWREADWWREWDRHNAAATKSLFGRMKTIGIKGGKVVNSVFKRQTEGYLQPGDRAFAIVCIDIDSYKKTLLAQSSLDKVYNKRLADAVEMVRAADKELGMDKPLKEVDINPDTDI